MRGSSLSPNFFFVERTRSVLFLHGELGEEDYLRGGDKKAQMTPPEKRPQCYLKGTHLFMFYTSHASSIHHLVTTNRKRFAVADKVRCCHFTVVT